MSDMSVDALKAEDATAGAVKSTGVGRQFLLFIEPLLLSLWLGSVVFFSFAVAS